MHKLSLIVKWLSYDLSKTYTHIQIIVFANDQVYYDEHSAESLEALYVEDGQKLSSENWKIKVSPRIECLLLVKYV